MVPKADAGGDVAGVSSVHLVPSHVHVSSSRPALSDRLPPKRTTSCRTGSYVMAAANRGGGEVGGCCSAHVCPSQIQVSFLALPNSPPPNRTMLSRAAS